MRYLNKRTISAAGAAALVFSMETSANAQVYQQGFHPQYIDNVVSGIEQGCLTTEQEIAQHRPVTKDKLSAYMFHTMHNRLANDAQRMGAGRYQNPTEQFEGLKYGSAKFTEAYAAAIDRKRGHREALSVARDACEALAFSFSLTTPGPHRPDPGQVQIPTVPRPNY